MHHPIPRPLKGNYPFAVLHAFNTEGLPKAIELARKLSEEEMTHDEAIDYVSACVKTRGQPQLLDLFEDEEDRKDAEPSLREFNQKGGIILEELQKELGV